MKSNTIYHSYNEINQDVDIVAMTNEQFLETLKSGNSNVTYFVGLPKQTKKTQPTNREILLQLAKDVKNIYAILERHEQMFKEINAKLEHHEQMFKEHG